MQRTTSPRKRSRKRTSKAPLLFLIGVWGCASGPELVYVDMSAVEPMAVSAAPDARNEHSQEAISSSGEIPALEERSVFIGSDQDKATQALSLYLKTQEQAAESVLKGRREAYLAEVDSLQRDGEELILDEYRAWLDEAFEELHELFLQHAKKIGPLWHDLSWRVGFPDPDPGSITTSSDQFKARTLQEAKELRIGLRAMDGEFRTLVSERLSRIEEERSSRVSAFTAEMDEKRVDALERAQKDADAVTEQAFAILERSALDPEAQLPAVPSVGSAVNSEPAPRWNWPSRDRLAESQDDLRAHLEVFLKVNGFKLAKSPGKARDVTQEFVVWRRNYLAGR